MSHHPLPDLRALGYRRTPQRQLVWDVLHQQGPYLTAEEIYQRIKKQFPDFSLVTVYRNLASMRKMGLVQEINSGKGPLRYVTSMDYHGGPQFVCGDCGSIVEVQDTSLQSQAQLVAEANGFIIDHSSDIVIYSRCHRCAEATVSQSAEPSA